MQSDKLREKDSVEPIWYVHYPGTVDVVRVDGAVGVEIAGRDGSGPTQSQRNIRYIVVLKRKTKLMKMTAKSIFQE